MESKKRLGRFRTFQGKGKVREIRGDGIVNIPTRKRREEPLSPLPEGSDASGGGRTTTKKKVRSSHLFHQKDGSACIVPDKRRTEHAHEVKAISYDSKLLGEKQGWSLSKSNEV
ncbi:hypothetical protein Tco_0180214 [Tanacetum coccineum]